MKKLDLHSKITSEAQIAIESFILECYMQRITECVIVHGYGKYVLKEVCWEHLKTNKYVENFSLAPIGLGGAGATYVKIKNKPSKKRASKN